MFQGLRYAFPLICSELIVYLKHLIQSKYCQACALSTNEESESDVEGFGLESFAGISDQLAEGGPMVAPFNTFLKKKI